MWGVVTSWEKCNFADWKFQLVEKLFVNDISSFPLSKMLFDIFPAHLHGNFKKRSQYRVMRLPQQASRQPLIKSLCFNIRKIIKIAPLLYCYVSIGTLFSVPSIHRLHPAVIFCENLPRDIFPIKGRKGSSSSLLYPHHSHHRSQFSITEM